MITFAKAKSYFSLLVKKNANLIHAKSLQLNVSYFIKKKKNEIYFLGLKAFIMSSFVCM